MEREEEGGGGVVVRGRVEIDMRQPFRSVKEAVLLFGEKVLATEVYANKLNEMKVKEKNAKHPITKQGGALTADHHQEELEQTKQLSNAKDDTNNLMVQCLNSLRQELEQTKMELRQLKSRESHVVENDKQLIDPEIEELKFIENSSKNNKVEIKRQTDVEDVDFEFERKRSVKFASPPLLTRVIVSKDDAVENGEHMTSPRKKTKKKPLVSLMGGLFVKKEGKQRK